MTDTLNTRTIETKNADGTWSKRDSMLDLDVGDVFRMFDADSKPVVDHNGHSEYKAVGKPFVDDSGVQGVQAEAHQSKE